MKETFLQVRGKGDAAVLFLAEEDRPFGYQESIGRGNEVELMFQAEEEFMKRRSRTPGLHIREATSRQAPRPKTAQTPG